ncbi:MAG: Hsp20/alpha crystallin family protein [Anaerolineae bacterium]|nr:Hsp20/alpha crystallin family protein [Anaerolineae bacterium]
MPITDLIPWRKKEPVQQEQERSVQSSGQPFTAFQQEMNRLFDDFFGRSALEPFGALREGWDMFSPRVDVAETEQDVIVSAELPGLDNQDIDVSLSHGLLTISGEKKQEKEKKGRNYYHVERSYGSFQRSVPLPSEVDAGKVDAVFKNGVLTITLPKAGGTKAGKKIAIKT